MTPKYAIRSSVVMMSHFLYLSSPISPCIPVGFCYYKLQYRRSAEKAENLEVKKVLASLLSEVSHINRLQKIIPLPPIGTAIGIRIIISFSYSVSSPSSVSMALSPLCCSALSSVSCSALSSLCCSALCAAVLSLCCSTLSSPLDIVLLL